MDLLESVVIVVLWCVAVAFGVAAVLWSAWTACV